MSESPRQKLERLAFDSCTPVNATIELTLACNLRCVHCYNFDRALPYPKQRASAELSRAELLAAIDQLADAGALFLSFTGGEAMAHPNLLELVRHARARRCAVNVKTNGVHLAERAGELRAAGVGTVDVSIYGATAATHDAFTLAPGSFERTITGVRGAAAAGIVPRVSICLVRSNAAEVGAMVELVRDLGVSASLDPHVTARYDGDRASLDLRLDRGELLALYRGPLRTLLDPPDCHRDAPDSVQCSCARSVVAIASNGDVYPCIGAPMRAGNIRERPFAEIWRDSPELQRIRALSLPDFPSCAPCPDRAWCRRSSGTVFVNTGDYTGAEEWTCMEASVLRQIAEEGERG